MSLKCECGEKASFILFEHNPDKLIPICEQCLNKQIEMLGEVNLDFYEINDPHFLNILIEEVNKQFKWHDVMLKRLYKQIKKMKEVSK